MNENLKEMKNDELLKNLCAAVRVCTKAGLDGGDTKELQIEQDRLYSEVRDRLNSIAGLELTIELLDDAVGAESEYELKDEEDE